MKTSFLEAFTAPLKEPRGIGKLLFGGFLMILSSILMLNWGEFFKLGKDYEYIFSILFLIGLFIQFIPLGYCVKSAHECIQDEFLIMPEWSNIGEYLARGIISAIILFIYAIPFFILAFLGGILIVTLGVNPLLIYLLLFFVSCLEVMIVSTVLMFYFKDMKFTDAFRLVIQSILPKRQNDISHIPAPVLSGVIFVCSYACISNNNHRDTAYSFNITPFYNSLILHHSKRGKRYFVERKYVGS